MEKTRIVQAAGFAFMLVVFASCSSSREYGRGYGHYPSRTSVSLILHTGPGFVISRYPDGRYYYRAPNGYIYWRGYDNRYYLDRRYVTRNYYHHRQYNDWRRYNRRR